MHIEALQAREGDCLVLFWDGMVAVVDGGPTATYTESLGPRLAELRAERGLRGHDALAINWLLVSHIDGDHIGGLVAWTDDLVREESNGSLRSRVDQIWLNTFDDVAGHRIPDGVIANANTQSAVSEIGASKRAVVASVPQARVLVENVAQLQVSRNHAFGGDLVRAAMPGEHANIAAFGDLLVTVIAPQEDRLVVLQEAWASIPRAARESAVSVAAYTDKSIYNLSSIACLLEHDGTSALLTGDALGSDIVDSLTDIGLLEPSLHVSILKVPHHGSVGSVDAAFFQSITADHYILSGNGRYGNPNTSTLDLLVDARDDDEFTLHFTYFDSSTDGHPERISAWVAAQRAHGRRFAVEQATAPSTGQVPRVRI